MREILFRGKSNRTKEWVYGYYWLDSINKTHKITVDLSDDNFICHEVDPETVGQFIGLFDKTDAKIFEKDIVKFYTRRHSSKGLVREVEFEFGLATPFYDDEFIQDEQGDWFVHDKGFEIIGNTIDTPELLA